jgi:putative oxidoreductase
MDSVNTGLLVLRLALGAVFLAHGLKHYRKRTGTMRWIESMGFANTTLQWFFMSFAEIGVGVSLALGLLTSIGVAGLVALMVVAFWTVHRHAGFWVTARPDEGWEYVFVLSVAGVSLALFGPGRWSLDHALGIAKAMDGWVGLAIAAAGVLAAAGQLAVFYRRPTE